MKINIALSSYTVDGRSPQEDEDYRIKINSRLANSDELSGSFKNVGTKKTFWFADISVAKKYGVNVAWGVKQGATHVILLDRGNTRFAKISKTVAYVITDEDDSGNAIWTKWNITDQRTFSHSDDSVPKFTTYVKINTGLSQLVKKLGTWYDPKNHGILIFPYSDSDNKLDSTANAMRLIQGLGCDLLIQNHTTVRGTGDWSSVVRALTGKTLPN